LRVVADVGSEDPEDDIFGDVGSVIGDAFEIASNEKGVESLLRGLGFFVHLADKNNEGLVTHAVDDVIHLEDRLREFGLAVNKGFEGAADHGADGCRHAMDVDRHIDGGKLDEIHDALGDVDGLIADALEIGVDLGDGENEAQVDGGGLLGGKNVESEFVDFALGGIDQAFVFENELAAGEVAFVVSLAGAVDGEFRESAHAEEFLAEFFDLLLKTGARHGSENLVYPNLPVT
jgi:hypothetical protein